MSNPNVEQLAAAQKANTEVLLNLMLTAFNGVERLTALNIAAAREFFNTSVAGTQSLLAAKDPQAIAQLNSDLAKPGLDKLMEYSRSVYELGTEVQKELSAVVEAHYAGISKDAAGVIQKAAAAAPVGGDVMAAAFKSVMDASNQAISSVSAVTKQLTELAETNVKAASTSVATTKAVAAKKTRSAK